MAGKKKKSTPKKRNPSNKKFGRTHLDWINDVLSDEQYSKEYEMAVQVMPNGAVITHPDKYKIEYDEIAFKTMQDANSTMCHLCATLGCSEPTLRSWLKRHPSFRQAYLAGKTIAQVKFRKKLADYAYKSSQLVNNGLIKLLAKNVHGIDVDEPAVVINNNQSNTIVSDKESAKLYAEALGRDE